MVESVFHYDIVTFEDYEWDNIPQVVPRFVIHLEKYVQGLSEFCNEIKHRENIKDLRADFESRFEVNTEEKQVMRQTDLAEKEKINNTTGFLESELEQLRMDLEDYQAEVISLKGNGLEQFNHAMEIYMSVTDRLKPLQIYPPPKVPIKCEDEMNKHRMFSFKQLYHIIGKIMKNSFFGD